MFDDFELDELKAIRKKLALQMIENAGYGSISLPDGISIAVDNRNVKEVAAMIDAAIRRKSGRSIFIPIERR
jgi:hypothetical protein